MIYLQNRIIFCYIKKCNKNKTLVITLSTDLSFFKILYEFRGEYYYYRILKASIVV